VILAAVTLAIVTQLAPATTPVRPASSARQARDPAAARDVVALVRAGERGSWSAVFDFTRTLAGGRVLHESMREARNPVMHVLRSTSSMTVQRAGRDYECNLVEGRWVCTHVGGGAVLPASAVLRVAVAAGAYDVTRLPDALIAGEHTRCFRVLTSGRGFLPDIGSESDLCLAADGVPMSSRLVRGSGDVDERVARVVDRRVTTRTIEVLAAGFHPPSSDAAAVRSGAARGPR
jgi:hypothetical protein